MQFVIPESDSHSQQIENKSHLLNFILPFLMCQYRIINNRIHSTLPDRDRIIIEIGMVAVIIQVVILFMIVDYLKNSITKEAQLIMRY